MQRTKRYDAIHACRCGVIGGRGGKKKKKGRRELDSWEISMVLSRFDSIACVPGRVSVYDIADFPFEHNIRVSSDRLVSMMISLIRFFFLFLLLLLLFWRSPEKKISITNWKKNS